MNDNRDKRNGEIFPDLRRGTTEATEEQKPQTANWQGRPLEPRQEPSTREFRRQSEFHQPVGPKTGRRWLALAFLLAIVAGMSFYGYRVLQNIQASQIPSMLNSMTAINSRLGDVEAKVRLWPENWQGLTDRMATLEKRVNANYRSARRHAEVLTTQLEERMTDEMESRNYIVDTRLNQLDAEQKSAQERIAQLRQELSDARQEVASLRHETNGDLALLHQQVAGNGQQVQALADQVERQRVNFELAKNQPSELAPGISMKLTATDARYQRFSGWVYFLPDRRFLWVRHQGVQQPVVFYDQNQARRYEVVISSVRNNSAAGYLLLPVGSGVGGPETAASAAGGR